MSAGHVRGGPDQGTTTLANVCPREPPAGPVPWSVQVMCRVDGEGTGRALEAELGVGRGRVGMGRLMKAAVGKDGAEGKEGEGEGGTRQAVSCSRRPSAAACKVSHARRREVVLVWLHRRLPRPACRPTH